MPAIVLNPYNGDEEETCSVSFQAQQEFLGGPGVSNQQTEAEFNKSKLLGEWGVIAAKLGKGEIASGTKVLTYSQANGKRGYAYVKGSKLHYKFYDAKGDLEDDEQDDKSFGEILIKSKTWKAAIPQAVSSKPKPEPVKVFYGDPGFTSSAKASHKPGQVIAVGVEQYIKMGDQGKYELWQAADGGYVKSAQSSLLSSLMDDEEAWFKPDKKDATPNATPATTSSPPSSAQVAAPTATAAVDAGSESVGSMSHEDVAAMFVKIKDDLAKEQGLNIKGANPELDAVVYKAIGGKTGYTPAEVKGKIDAYKAQGNKLSALKKKVLAGTKKVPEGKPQPTHASPAAPLNTGHSTNKPVQDPKPNDVPTVATPNLANEIKEEVKQEAAANPAKVYSDEDVAAAYIIAKDKIVAASNGKWTLYTKSDELDLEIAIAVGLKTKLNPTQQKQAIANYLGSGKKLSTLKKQLAKQGAFQPQADTLKKSKAEQTQEEKEKEVEAKADEGYTPTPTPATGTPPTETGKPTPERVKREAVEAGDISAIPDSLKKLYFEKFKQKTGTYLSTPEGTLYDNFLQLQVEMQQFDHSKNITMLQLLRVVDEYGAKKAGVENGKLFEKKVATWLTTKFGKFHLEQAEAKKAKLLEDSKKKAEAAKLAKELEANQPPLPADSAQFQEMSPTKALGIQKVMLGKKPFGPGEKEGLRHYTGGAYHAMNGYLRGINTHIDPSDKRHIAPAIRGFRPSPEPMLLRRGTGANQFVTLGVGRGETHLLWGITGKTFEDKGFLSTSAAGRAAFGGEVALEIEAPIGTPAMWVDNFSKHPGENEMLLAPGLKYKILNVRKEGSTFVMRLRIVDWPGKEA